MSSISSTQTSTRVSTWLFRLQCACTLQVALIAAYVSYRHGRDFALKYGADETTALLWPLVVDGLLDHRHGRAVGHQPSRWWPVESLVIVRAGYRLVVVCEHRLGARDERLAIAVAACPPLALLLSVGLLNQALKRHRASADEHHELTKAPASNMDKKPGPADQITVSATSAEHKPEHNAAGHTPDQQVRDPAHAADDAKQFARALALDAEHWRTYGKRIPHETLRRDLKVGSARSRQLNKRVRAHRQRQLAATRLEPEQARLAAVPVPTL